MDVDGLATNHGLVIGAPALQTKASSSIGRAAVSKTAGWGFESLLACQRQAGEIMNVVKPKEGSEQPFHQSADQFKKTAAAVLIVAALFVFYFFDESIALLFRVIGLVFAFSMAVVLYALTEKGKATFAFLLSSRQELHRVTWPTRTETVQTTILVLAIVFLISIFFWLIDMALGTFVQWLIS